MKKLLAVLPLMLLMAGCDVAKSSRDGIASAKGALDAYKAEYQCNTATPQAACGKVQSAVALKDLAIDALTVYCSGPGFDSGGPCQPSPDKDKKQVAALKLQAVMKQLNQIMKDLQSLKGKV